MSRLLARLLLASLALLAATVCAGSAVATLGCCAIDASRFPEQAARNARRQQQASLLALAACVTAIGATVAAVRVGRRTQGGRAIDDVEHGGT